MVLIPAPEGQGWGGAFRWFKPLWKKKNFFFKEQGDVFDVALVSLLFFLRMTFSKFPGTYMPARALNPSLINTAVGLLHPTGLYL